jgi:hypothetical protein
MKDLIKTLAQRSNITIFDRTPIYKRIKDQIVNKLHTLLPILPYDCCELIAAEQSDTLYALLDQLNSLKVIDDSTFNILNSDVTENVMTSISLKCKTNFLFIDPVVTELHYYVNIIDGGFDNTMIIYTSERDMFDGDEHLNLILNCNPRIEDKKMFHEYMLTYDSINKYELSADFEFAHFFDYDQDNREFNNFPGTHYDAAIYASLNSWMGVDAYTSINDGKSITLKRFVLHLMKMTAGGCVIVVIIFNQSYYIFGESGFMGFTIIEIDNNGTITIPNITLHTLLNNYKIGHISKIINNTILN